MHMRRNQARAASSPGAAPVAEDPAAEEEVERYGEAIPADYVDNDLEDDALADKIYYNVSG